MTPAQPSSHISQSLQVPSPMSFSTKRQNCWRLTTTTHNYLIFPLADNQRHHPPLHLPYLHLHYLQQHRAQLNQVKAMWSHASSRVAREDSRTVTSISEYFLYAQRRNFISNKSRSKHKKSHDHPEHCPHCSRGFETSKDVRRHIKDKHTRTKDFHCPVTGCKYARGGRGGGFGRKDNWKRHLLKQHAISDESPSLRLSLSM